MKPQQRVKYLALHDHFFFPCHDNEYWNSFLLGYSNRVSFNSVV